MMVEVCQLVLNRIDISGYRGFLNSHFYTEFMQAISTTELSAVYRSLPPLHLCECIFMVMGAVESKSVQAKAGHWSHFPVSITCTISWIFQGEVEVVKGDWFTQPDAQRQRMSRLIVSGPQTQPCTTWDTKGTRGLMVMFYPDAWQEITGVTVESLKNQVRDASTVLPPWLLERCERLFSMTTDEARLNDLYASVAEVWMRRSSNGFSLSAHAVAAKRLGHWTQALALRALTSGAGRSLRQSERRIKQWTGWSMRKLNGLVRGEATLFAVLQAMSEDKLDWAQIALDLGFSDQSHLVRETKRLTGFSPEALRHGLLYEESFWAYRAWSQLLNQP